MPTTNEDNGRSLRPEQHIEHFAVHKIIIVPEKDWTQHRSECADSTNSFKFLSEKWLN